MSPVYATPSQSLVKLLQPSGRLSAEYCQGLWEQLKAALEASSEAVVVDLMHVSYISAESLDVFKAGIRLSLQLGKSLTFHGAQTEIQQLLAAAKCEQEQQELGPYIHDCQGSFEQFLAYQPIAAVRCPAAFRLRRSQPKHQLRLISS